MKPEVLFLAHRIPYPPDKGDKIRSWRILDYLIQRFRVHLACFADDPRDLAHQAFLETICDSATIVPLDSKNAKRRSTKAFLTGEPLSFQYFRDAAMTRAVAALRAKPLAAEIAFSSAMAPYIEKPFEGRRRIVDFCDADSEKWRSYAASASGAMKRVYTREAKMLSKAETGIANWADASFAVTPDEAAIFNARPGMSKTVGWFRNGVDTDYFNPADVDASGAPQNECAFVGAMDYRPNVTGVFYFIDRVWPLIRKAVPGARFAIVGANPSPALAAVAGADGIAVTGRVEDVRPWLAGAKTVVAPLRVARGVQNKVLEAMAMGKPVVATPEAMTGVDAPGDAATTAASPEEMAGKILALLGDNEKRRAMGDAARRHAVENYQWAAALAPLGQTFDAFGL